MIRIDRLGEKQACDRPRRPRLGCCSAIAGTVAPSRRSESEVCRASKGQRHIDRRRPQLHATRTEAVRPRRAPPRLDRPRLWSRQPLDTDASLPDRSILPVGVRRRLALPLAVDPAAGPRQAASRSRSPAPSTSATRGSLRRRRAAGLGAVLSRRRRRSTRLQPRTKPHSVMRFSSKPGASCGRPDRVCDSRE